nr:putative reverse transcriptase domain-containing protein [Tanacetum cinerariifolium]
MKLPRRLFKSRVEFKLHMIVKRVTIQAAHDRQKSYVDVRRKPLEFQVGDKVNLKISPWKGVIHFGKRGKLNPRDIGPFKVLAKVRTVAYKLELPRQLSKVHSRFHVSNFKKCLSDELLVIPLDEIQIDNKLHFIDEPVEILDREVKRLKQSRIPTVKTDVQVFVDFTTPWKDQSLSRVDKSQESRHELRLVAGIAIGCLDEGGTWTQVTTLFGVAEGCHRVLVGNYYLPLISIKRVSIHFTKFSGTYLFKIILQEFQANTSASRFA